GNSPTGKRARTLRQFVDVVDHATSADLDGHLRRKDFSRWIVDVFGDYRLSNTIGELEDAYRLGKTSEIAESLGREIRLRYDFTGEGLGLSGPKFDGAHAGG
ncbi:MAG: hypothetical protein ABI824_18865, partial [Acidobacteriota bacterium]